MLAGLRGAARRTAGRAVGRLGLQRRVEIPPDLEPAFVPLYERCRPFTMCSAERQYALYQAMAYLRRARIEGDIVECGVWRGGSVMMAALCAEAQGDSGRRFVLYDTFGDFPEPEERDGELASAIWRNISSTGRLAGSALPRVDEVRYNLLSTGIRPDQLVIVQGRVEETIPDRAPERIALLRLDTDWYSSTRHELEHLYPRLEPGGVLIIDDYGYMQGARQATDEFMTSISTPLMLTRVDGTARLAMKPSRD